MQASRESMVHADTLTTRIACGTVMRVQLPIEAIKGATRQFQTGSTNEIRELVHFCTPNATEVGRTRKRLTLRMDRKMQSLAILGRYFPAQH